MLVLLRPQEQPAATKVLGDVGVGVLDEPAADELRSLVGEGTGVVHGVVDGPAFPSADLEVLGAVAGGDVHDARPLVHRDEVRGHHPVRVAVHVGVQRFVASADERRPRQ